MTTDELNRELDRLAELTNDDGKRILLGVRNHVNLKPEVVWHDPHGRRGEERDPGESEQHLAETLGLTNRVR